MLTLWLQNLCALLLLVFAVCACLAATRLPKGDVQRAGWMVTGAVFMVYTLDMVVQDVFGTWAYYAGANTPVMDFYLRLAPIADHSRTLLMFALYGLLLAVPFRERFGGAAPRLAAAAIAVSLLAGGVLGWHEGVFRPERHLTLTAQIDTFGFMVLSGVLLFSMFRSSMDRLLWFTLAVYGITSVLGVLFLQLIAWVGVIWSPPASSM
ncbi:MAG TPA: hypothetical protein VFJ16_18885, partial [Longimicrobium sp.]|nr:hypothetical protein [Longimicrobium sp.]